MNNPFTFDLRVYYEDTDFSGVAYHANYLRWFERARTEWLRALGYEQQRLCDELGVVFTVSALNIEYRRPARLDDVLTVQVRVRDVRRASLVFEQTLLRAVDAQTLAHVEVKVACVDARQFRPCAMPAALQAAMHASALAAT